MNTWHRVILGLGAVALVVVLLCPWTYEGYPNYGRGMYPVWEQHGYILWGQTLLSAAAVVVVSGVALAVAPRRK